MSVKRHSAEGPNLQQLPKKEVTPFLQMARQNWDLIRQAFAVPDPRWKLIQNDFPSGASTMADIDYNGLELRLLADMERQGLKASTAPYTAVLRGRRLGLTTYWPWRDRVLEARTTAARLGQPRMDAPGRLKLLVLHLRTAWPK